MFQADFYPGESVIVLEAGVRNPAVVREKTLLAEMEFPDGFKRPGCTKYGVDIQSEQFSKSPRRVVDSDVLCRERGIFSKSVLKAFLRNAVRRESPSSPWLIKEPYTKKYKLFVVPRAELAKGVMSKLTSSQSTPQQPQAIDDSAGPKGPVEDLHLPATDSCYPSPHTHWPVTPNLVQCLLETWAFFNVFLEVLTLDSFTLDDFSDALASQGPCELIEELYCCVLKTFVIDQHQADSGLSRLLEFEQEPSSLSERGSDHGLMITTWRDALAQQEFSNGRFFTVLAGLIATLVTDATDLTRAQPILDHLMSPGEIKVDVLPQRFRSLSADLKLQLIALLVDLTWDATLIRHYIDECMDHLTQLRKDRALLAKEKRTFMDAIYQLRMKMRASTVTTSPASKEHLMVESRSHLIDAPEAADKPKSLDTDIANGKPRSKRFLATTKSRGHSDHGNSLPSRLIINNQETPLKDEHQNPEHTNKDAAQCAIEIARLRRLVTRVEDKLNKVEEEFRESDSQRLRKLGQDRFFSTYWFLESSGMPVFGMPNCSTSHALYATGRIVVQGTSEADMEELRSRSELHEVDYIRRRLNEQNLGPGTWGYYDSVEQINALLSWLNPKGIREARLKSAIDLQGENISQSMENRQRYLVGKTLSERRSQRKNKSGIEPSSHRSHHNWKNLMARKIHGMAHSDTGTGKLGQKIHQ